MAHEVFISHAYKDKGVADAICRELESANARCWIAPRNISTGEDWAKAVRKAIDSSRVVVLVLSENANTATHIEREIANAFYTERIILPFRVGNAIPRRSILSYLDNVRWFDSVDSPVEQNLQAFAVRVKEVLSAVPVARGKLAFPETIKGTARLKLVDAGQGSSTLSRTRISTKIKWFAVVTSIITIAWLLALASQQRNEDSSLKGTDQQSAFHDQSHSAIRRKEDPPSTSHYAFTRLGLWVAASPSPTSSPPLQSSEMPLAAPNVESGSAMPPTLSADQKPGTPQEAQADTPTVAPFPDRSVETGNRQVRHRTRRSEKAHDRRAAVSDASRLSRIKSWLSAFWRKIR
jgi:hypothetical protein